jgi:galactoside O-acetyltransferase
MAKMRERVDVTIREWVRWVRRYNIKIGDHVMIDDFVLICGGRGDVLTTIGNHVHIACFVSMMGGAGFTLMDYSSVSPGSRLFSETDDYTDGALINPTLPDDLRGGPSGRITLGKYSCIGANCVVLPGVTIGEGATIGACSLVTKNVEPWTVNVGTPTRVIKMRNKLGVLRRVAEFESR